MCRRQRYPGIYYCSDHYPPGSELRVTKMKQEMQQMPLAQMTSEEKKQYLFLNQKKTLDLFLERGAISQAQYDKSLVDLREKMRVKL